MCSRSFDEGAAARRAPGEVRKMFNTMEVADMGTDDYWNNFAAETPREGAPRTPA